MFTLNSMSTFVDMNSIIIIIYPCEVSVVITCYVGPFNEW
jgi:hypothetical protein